MANVDAAFGFRPIGENGSGVNTGGTTLYTIEDNYGTAIYKGDHVMSAGGYVIAGTTSGATNLGVFNGCFYIDPTTSKPTWKNYYPGAVNITTGTIDAYCYDNPQQLYEVQSAGTLTQASVFNLVDTATYDAGTSRDGLSDEEISGSLVSSGATGQWRILRLSEDPSNSDTGSANANWIVRLNESIYYNGAVLT